MMLIERHKVKAQAGFTLIELVIAILIISILGAIAYPNYVGSITRTKRKAAEACLSNFATHMERFYTTNLRYDQDAGGTAVALPSLECATTQARDYVFSLSTSTAVTRSTYLLQAVPQTANKQSTRDARCGTLTLDQGGNRGVLGTDTVANCW